MMNESTERPVNTTGVFDVKNINNLFCVYKHSIVYEDGEKLMFIGVSKLVNVFLSTAARRNKSWREHVGDCEGVIVTIVSTFENEYEAHTTTSRMIREERPHCNMTGEHTNNSGNVRCKTDEMTFTTAADACRYYGIHASTLSHHLARRSGYKTIRGLEFERC